LTDGSYGNITGVKSFEVNSMCYYASAPCTWSLLSFCFNALRTLWSQYMNNHIYLDGVCMCRFSGFFCTDCFYPVALLLMLHDKVKNFICNTRVSFYQQTKYRRASWKWLAHFIVQSI